MEWGHGSGWMEVDVEGRLRVQMPGMGVEEEGGCGDVESMRRNGSESSWSRGYVARGIRNTPKAMVLGPAPLRVGWGRGG